jgi:hypothetical protein
MTAAPFIRMITLATLVISSGVSSAGASEPVRLITPEEAGLPAPVSTDGQSRSITRGPGVDAVAPSALGAGSGPFRLALRFKPRNGIPIDAKSVRVTYRRQPDVNLTARILPFLTAAGIDAPAVVVPPGRHVIEIEVSDRDGRIGRGQITLVVDAPK